VTQEKIILTSHQPLFIPVIKSLAAEGYKFVTLDAAFAKTLVDLDLPARFLAEAGAGLQEMAFAEGVKILTAAHSGQHQNGLGPGPQQFMNQGLPAYLYPKLADLALLILTLDRVQPVAVMLHNDVEPMTRCAALWARARQVPCLHIPHAIYQDVGRGPAGTDVHDLITASFLAAAGPFQRRWYEMRGFPSEQIKETGMPHFDKWYTLPMDKRKARKMLQLDPGRPVVVYASTWPQATNALGIHDEWAVSYLEFLQAVKGLDGVQVIIKLHPRGGQENFNWHVQKAQQYKVECALTPLHNEVVLQAADLVLAYAGSNLILEAAHIPGLRLMTTHGYEDDAVVAKVGIDHTQMGEAMRVLLSQPAMDTMAMRVKYLGVPDGKATERVIEFVRELS
jgi:hypothetical protein